MIHLSARRYGKRFLPGLWSASCSVTVQAEFGDCGPSFVVALQCWRLLRDSLESIFLFWEEEAVYL